jgi:hypothetical protein
VSAIATATSTALDAAIPTISVSGAVAIARIASTLSPRSRERGRCPSASRGKKNWASGRTVGPPNVRIVKPSVAWSPGLGDRELVADGDTDQCEQYGWRAVVYRSPDRYGLINLNRSVVAPPPNRPWRESSNAGGEGVGEPSAGEPACPVR